LKIKKTPDGSLILKIFKYPKLMVLWSWFFLNTQNQMSITKFKYSPPNYQYHRICNYRTKIQATLITICTLRGT
jgi:hypothetical protein